MIDTGISSIKSAALFVSGVNIEMLFTSSTFSIVYTISEKVLDWTWFWTGFGSVTTGTCEEADVPVSDSLYNINIYIKNINTFHGDIYS